MNFQIYSVLFAVAFLGFASAQSDVPHATANMTSDSDKVSQGQSYTASCEYTIHKPSNHNSDSDWELSVAFHKETMSMNMDDRYPVIAEYRQNGTNMVFHTVKMVEGLNVWPADGVTTGLQSPKRITVIPSQDSMYSGGMWKCSVTMKLKGTDAKVRFVSKSYTALPGPSSPNM